jgi:hypothetical protein
MYTSVGRDIIFAEQKPGMGIESAEELYEMVSSEVPVLEDFEDDFRSDAAAYVGPRVVGEVDGLPRYVGEPLDEEVFEATVEDAVGAMAFIQVRDDQLDKMIEDLQEVSEYRVFDEGNMIRGAEARKALAKQRVALGSVDSDLREVSSVLRGQESIGFDPVMEQKKVYQVTDGPLMRDGDFDEPVETYWPFESRQ